MCGLNVVIGELDIWRGSPDHPVYHSIDWESWPAGPTGLCPCSVHPDVGDIHSRVCAEDCLRWRPPRWDIPWSSASRDPLPAGEFAPYLFIPPTPSLWPPTLRIYTTNAYVESVRVYILAFIKKV